MGIRKMRIRVLQGFAGYEPGQVFDDWPDGMCEVLILKGVIERVADNTADEAAEVEQEVSRAEMPARRKKAK